jgi:hypothetical protein
MKHACTQRRGLAVSRDRAPRRERRRPETAVVGELILFGHCRFTWIQPLSSYLRYVRLRPDHCPRCIAELERLALSEGFLVERRALELDVGA